MKLETEAYCAGATSVEVSVCVFPRNFTQVIWALKMPSPWAALALLQLCVFMCVFQTSRLSTVKEASLHHECAWDALAQNFPRATCIFS